MGNAGEFIKYHCLYGIPFDDAYIGGLLAMVCESPDIYVCIFISIGSSTTCLLVHLFLLFVYIKRA
jgi:hypothetical protein